jgi:hypothetical protein
LIAAMKILIFNQNSLYAIIYSSYVKKCFRNFYLLFLGSLNI